MNGSVAVKTAACPDNMYCSDQVTNPEPPTSMSAPLTRGTFSCLMFGRRSPRRRQNKKSSTPEMPNRKVHKTNGGKLSNVKITARKVVPQMKYIARKASKTRTDFL